MNELEKINFCNSGDFLFLSMKMQILRNLAKQEDISDSERQNAGDLIIDLEESIKPMSTGIKSITFDKNSNVRKIVFHKAPNIEGFDARDFLFTLMKGQLLKSLRKESEEIKNPEILNIDNLLVNLDKSIRRMGTGIKAIILDKDLNVKKVEFAPEVPNISADAPKEEIKPEETPEIKKQESNRWLLERIAPENMQRLNMSTGLRREREMSLSG